MPSSMTAAEILDREYLQVRARLLELAAVFDRLDRATGSVDGDPRMNLIHEGLAVLQSDHLDRAEQIQLLFSRQYDDDWREKFDLTTVR